MKSVLSRLKRFYKTTGKFLASILPFIILLSYLPSLGSVLYNKIFAEDVIALVIQGDDIGELLAVVKANWTQRLHDKTSDNENLKAFLETIEEESRIDVGQSLEIGLVRELFDFYVPSISDFDPLSREIILLEIQNPRHKKIEDISIMVPGVYSVSNVKVLAGQLHPQKINEIETSWSLNEESNTLFFSDIDELPPNSATRIYILGYIGYIPSFDHPVITFNGGTAKNIELDRMDPSMLRLYQRGIYPLWPNWQTFLISTILVLIAYLIIITRKQEAEDSKSSE